jgi:hypothetical protein
MQVLLCGITATAGHGTEQRLLQPSIYSCCCFSFILHQAA